MNKKPKAIEYFEREKLLTHEDASISLEHPIDRLKYHILQTGGKILKSEFSTDGFSYVTWETEGKQYKAWSSWPDKDYKIIWKLLT